MLGNEYGKPLPYLVVVIVVLVVVIVIVVIELSMCDILHLLSFF